MHEKANHLIPDFRNVAITLEKIDKKKFLSYFLDNYPTLLSIKLLLSLHKTIIKLSEDDWIDIVNDLEDLNLVGHYSLIFFLVNHTNATRFFLDKIGLNIHSFDDHGGFDNFYNNVKNSPLARNNVLSNSLYVQFGISDSDLFLLKKVGNL